ncbi:MAG: type I glyceraldehyde-3-phosphate dehydrogenase [Phototrophicaceae bacterium]
MAKVAINGIGRIGRVALRAIMETPELELVGLNDLGDVENMAYLIKYDSIYGNYPDAVKAVDGGIQIGDKVVPYYSEKDPAALPWGATGVDIVFECTGFFTEKEGAEKHIQAGAKFVIISGPTKSSDVPTVIHGVNKEAAGYNIISCASCTTNSAGPVMEILGRHFGIEKAVLNTIHAYTATQAIHDMPVKKDMRRGRAAALSWVPGTTGAAKAVALAMPELKGKFDGISVRGPVPVGSLSDITLLLSRNTTVEELNQVFRDEAASAQYAEIFAASDDELVSADIVGMRFASMVDLTMTKVVDGNLVKVLAWYDNESSYTWQMIRKAVEIAGAM